jgi:FlaA1/EpsC-like NDP-sugar epimerase
MGEPVRIADIARRLVAVAAHPVDIVFTGLRPGEKLVEDLLGQGEVDDRPHHPLIRHTRVTQLLPEQLSGIDLSADPGCLRQDLAQRAGSQGTDDVGSRLPRQAIRR